MKNYDVAIIGAGPAGLFAAHYILNHSKLASVILIDMGNAIQNRKCCGNCQTCADRNRCCILCGVGGSGLFSDGKLILDLHSGGKLDSITNLSDEKRDWLQKEIVDTLKRHDGKSKLGPGFSIHNQEVWHKRFGAEGLHIKHYDVLHMGTANLYHITTGFAKEICESPRLCLKLGCEIVGVEPDPYGQSTLYTSKGECFSASNVVFSVGKIGSIWLDRLFQKNGICFIKENTYIGVRVETAHEAIKELFDYSFDPKIWTYYGDRKVKTHCFCRRGDIVCANYMGFLTVGGHTRFTENNDTPLSQQSLKGNFNILVSTKCLDSDILQILECFRYMNPDGIMAQRLLDFLDSETDITAENIGATVRNKTRNIRSVLDRLESTGTIIADFIRRLGKIVPGILNENSLVYAPALEWFMNRVEVNSNMETSIEGWFAVGDGAGLSQGIVHSAATSIIAAEEICRRITK